MLLSEQEISWLKTARKILATRCHKIHHRIIPTALNIPGYGTAVGGWYCRRSQQQPASCRRERDLIRFPRPRHHTTRAAGASSSAPKRWHGRTAAASTARPLPPGRTHARTPPRPAPPRIGSTGQPTPAALRALKTKPSAKQRGPRVRAPSPRPRTLGPRHRIPRTALRQPASQPSPPVDDGGGSRGRGRAD